MINKLVEFCDTQYNRDKSGRCKNCPNDEGCTSCFNCLEKIHDVNTHERTYNCPNIAYCYTCKYLYRYSSEIEHLLKRYNFINVHTLRVCSIGCGPCSDLFGLYSWKTRNSLTWQIEYKGFELNRIWEPIHNQIKLPDCDAEFVYDEVFQYYQAGTQLPNVLILNYVLSDVLKNNPDDFTIFIDNLCVLYQKMSNSVLIVNDINLGRNEKEIRFHFDTLIQRIQKDNDVQIVDKFHFENTQKSYFRYGTQHIVNNAIITPLQNINAKYSPWVECRSAQLFIFKKQHNDT
ncbi:hypothetical protein SAMD00024442_17_28 [Candidatus Symbiothrix dinenymphae]|nr:hypothetical protein SAMD00024442_17_28 [Candidatus Symbiothrix dinenymphae]